MLINVFLITGIILCIILFIFCGFCEFLSDKDFIIYALLIICICMYFYYLIVFNRR